MGTLPRDGSVTVEVPASPDQVWAVLADVTRNGEWGHESQSGEWLDGATAAAPGVRFRGRNERGRTRWSRVCEVTVADAPTRIGWRTVPSRLYPDSTRWTYELRPTDTGCEITQRFEVLKLNPVIDRLFYVLIPEHRDRSDALRADLVQLGEAAAVGATTPSS